VNTSSWQVALGALVIVFGLYFFWSDIERLLSELTRVSPPSINLVPTWQRLPRAP
jgi:hypothetical protein